MNTTSLSIDGVSVAPIAVATVQEPELAYQLSELKRKLERKDLDIKRKDKENQSNLKEIARINKELKHAAAELESLRERNETLQQALITQKLQAQHARDDSELKTLRHRVADMEQAIISAAHKLNIAEGENEASKKHIAILEKRINECLNQNDALEVSGKASREAASQASIREAEATSRFEAEQQLVKQLKSDVTSLETEKNQLLGLNQNLSNEKSTCMKQIADLKKEVRQLSTNLVQRGEMNDGLQTQLDDLHAAKVFITQAELDRYQKLDGEIATVRQAMHDLSKKVEVQMNTLNASELENMTLRGDYQASQLVVESQKAALKESTERTNRDSLMIAELRKEVLRSRKETEELVHGYRDRSAGIDKDMQTLKSTIVTLVRAKQQEIDLKQLEIRKRKTVELSMKGLKNRIAFLLEQLEVAASIAVSWQEQRELFRAQCSAFGAANQELRQRIIDMNTAVVDSSARMKAAQQLQSSTRLLDANPVSMATSSGSANLRRPPLPSSAKRELTADMAASNSAFLTDLLEGNDNSGQVAAEVDSEVDLPHAITSMLPASTAPSIVERSLLDILVAFGAAGNPANNISSNNAMNVTNSTTNTTMTTTMSTTTSKKKRTPSHRLRSDQAGFKVKSLDDGSVEIELTEGVDKAGAAELLSALQLPSFMKFVQGRPEAKAPQLFAEKIVSILNHHRTIVAEYAAQLAECRMEVAKYSSRVTVSLDRVDRMKAYCYSERSAKQISVLKYVCEVLNAAQTNAAVLATYHDLAQAATTKPLSSSTSSSSNNNGRNNRSTVAGGVFLTSIPTSAEVAPIKGNEHADDKLKVELTKAVRRLSAISVLAESTSIRGGDSSSKVPTSSNSNSSISVPNRATVGIELKLASQGIDDELLHNIIALVSGELHDDSIATALEGGVESLRQNNNSSIANTTGMNPEVAALFFANRPVDVAANSTDVSTLSRLALTPNSTKNELTRPSENISTIATANRLSMLYLINLRSNSLTDLTCKILAPVLQSSTVLRMLDLRDNMISEFGMQMLFEAVRSNSSIVLVTKKQNGAMLEGHRELTSTDAAPPGSDRDIKNPLRVDLRYNDPDRPPGDQLLDSLAIASAGRSKVAAGNGTLRDTMTSSNRKLQTRTVRNQSHPDSDAGTEDGWVTDGKSDTLASNAVGLRGVLMQRKQYQQQQQQKQQSVSGGIERSLSLQEGIASQARSAHSQTQQLQRSQSGSAVDMLLNVGSDYEGGDDSDYHSDTQRGTQVSTNRKRGRAKLTRKRNDSGGLAINHWVLSNKSNKKPGSGPAVHSMTDILNRVGLGNIALNMDPIASVVSNMAPISNSNMDESIEKLQNAIMKAKLGKDSRSFVVQQTVPSSNSAAKRRTRSHSFDSAVAKVYGAKLNGKPASSRNPSPTHGAPITAVKVKDRIMTTTKAVYYNKPPIGTVAQTLQAHGNSVSGIAGNERAIAIRNRRDDRPAMTLESKIAADMATPLGVLATRQITRSEGEENQFHSHLNSHPKSIAQQVVTKVRRVQTATPPSKRGLKVEQVDDLMALGSSRKQSSVGPEDNAWSEVRAIVEPLSLYGPPTMHSKKPILPLKLKTDIWAQEQVTARALETERSQPEQSTPSNHHSSPLAISRQANSKKPSVTNTVDKRRSKIAGKGKPEEDEDLRSLHSLSPAILF